MPTMGRGLDIVYAVGGALSSPVWGINLLRTGKWRSDWSARLGYESIPEKACQRGPGDMGTLLIHTVSVGETNLIRPLVAQLHQQYSYPKLRIVICATTNTGYQRAVDLYRDEHEVVRYPLDFSSSVNRFLDRIAPNLIALAELEVWPNFVEAAAKRDIPIGVINGRLTERSFRRYQRLGPLVYRTFRQLNFAGVQTDDYAARFHTLGVPQDRVQVMDTMKWDAAHVADTVEGADELAAEMGIDRDKPLVVAGSTGPGEEKMLLDAKPAGVQLLLVPRRPERFEEVAGLSPQMVRRTKAATENAQGELFLLDTMGELRKAYALADVVIVGRSFRGLYGSDMMEPIALAKPTIIGPRYSDFAGMMQPLIEANGIIVTTDPWPAAIDLLDDRDKAGQLAQRGRSVILAHQGAAQRYADLLLDQLKKKD